MKHIANKEALGAADSLEAFGHQPDDPGVDPSDAPSAWERFDLGFLVAVLIFVAAIACLVIGLWARPARAHDWYSGSRNPVSGILCCYGGPTGDCTTLADDQWWREGDRYVVRWSDGKVYSIPVSHALPSQDHEGRAAACVLGGFLRCFYLPTTG